MEENISKVLQEKANNEAAAQAVHTSTTITPVQQMTSNVYISKAEPKIIKFSSRASIKIVDRAKQEHYYTVEYGEERQINNFEEVNIDKERQLLIDDCNKQVDNQVEEIINTFLK